MKTYILNILKLISIKLDVASIAVIDQHLVINNPCNRIANKAHNLIANNNIENVQ